MIDLNKSSYTHTHIHTHTHTHTHTRARAHIHIVYMYINHYFINKFVSINSITFSFVECYILQFDPT